MDTVFDHPHSGVKALPPLNVSSTFGLLEAALKTYPNQIAIDFLGSRTSYRELFESVGHVAAGLQALGVQKGDRVGVCLPNTPYSVILFFAVQRIGGIVVNINPLYVENEVHQVLIASGVKILALSDLAIVAKGPAAATINTAVEKIIVCPFVDVLPWGKSLLFKVLKSNELYKFPADKRLVRFRDVAACRKPVVLVSIDPAVDVSVFQFTGGTTGTPKAAMLSHNNLLSNIAQIDAHIGSSFVGHQVVLGILPLFHVFALTAVMLLSVSRGATMVLLPRFEAKATLDALARTKVTLMPTVPTILTALLRQEHIPAEAFAHLEAVISGGAPLPVPLRKQFEERAGCPVMEGYGLSETAPVMTFNPPHASRDGSCGTAVAGTEIEIRQIEAPHERLPTGQAGEVCVRGPQVMLGYWGGEKLESPFTEDGFFKTGDVGYFDDDGYLYLVDRLKDIILCGGYNVYPHVIEEALHRHPAVLETIVIGVPDDYRGQAPKAFVTLKEGFSATERELLDHVGKYVSKIERPREVVFRDALPKTLIGKLSRKDLIAQENLQNGGPVSAPLARAAC